MKPRGTFGDKPADVIQVLQLARKTGLLVLERSKQDGSIEQGTISLSNGQITDASLGEYKKNVALEMIMGWGNCYFVLYPPSSNGASTQPTSSKSTTAPLAPLSPASGPTNKDWAKDKLSPSGPYRLKQVDQALSYMNRLGLSRAHRQLFLLVDGQRPMKELVRLMGRRPDEVQVLFSDLVRAGLIRP